MNVIPTWEVSCERLVLEQQTVTKSLSIVSDSIMNKRSRLQRQIFNLVLQGGHLESSSSREGYHKGGNAKTLTLS